MPATAALLPAGVFLLAAMALTGLLYATLWLLVTRPLRRAPAPGLVRAPAHSSRQNLEALQHRLCGGAFCLLLLLFIWHLIYQFLLPAEAGAWGVAALAATGLLALGWHGQALARLAPEYLRLHRDTAAQIASAPSLDLLMRREYWVFHDVHVGDRHFHHVVMGLRGVFVADSLWRRPPGHWQWPGGWVRGDPAADYDGERLRLADCEETAPLEAVRARARWLAIYLSRKAGEPIPVQPAIALPGWRVTATDWKRTVVFNPSSPNLLIEAGRDGARLDPYVARLLVGHLKKAQEKYTDAART